MRRVEIPRVQFGIAAKLALLAFGTLLSMLVVTSYITHQNAKARARHALERQGDAIASTLNHTFEVLVDAGALVQLQRVTANTAFLPDVREVRVMDQEGNIIASTDRARIGTKTTSQKVLEVLRKEDFDPIVTYNDEEVDIVRPLFSGRYRNITDSGLVGAVEVILDPRALQADVQFQSRRLLLAELGAYAFISFLVALALRAIVVKRLEKLAAAAQQAKAGDYGARAALSGKDELSAVSEAFDEMAAEIAQTVDTLEEKVKARTEDLEKALQEKSKANEGLKAAQEDLEKALKAKSKANEELREAQKELETALDDSLRAGDALKQANESIEKTHAELVQSLQERLALASQIKELSTPVLRIHKGILTMPLIGQIDEARAKQIETKLLEGITAHDAEEVIVDLSGVPFVDPPTARALIRARRCAELVGTRITLVGLRGDVAKNIVAASLDLSSLKTQKNLESALLQALRRRGYAIHRRGDHGGAKLA